MKKVVIVALVIFLGLGIYFIKDTKTRAQNQGDISVAEQKSVPVVVRSAGELKQSVYVEDYPAVVEGMQEALIRANAAGVITALNFDFSDNVYQGMFLARIDDTGSYLDEGEEDFKSAQVQQQELALEQAQQAYKNARDAYEKQKTDINRRAKKIADLQRESAQLALDAALNNRVVTAPISGVVTSKEVAVGDSVSAGQLIARISKTDKKKVVFYASNQEYSSLKKGGIIKGKASQEHEFELKIDNISPKADETTHRFKIEAMPLQALDIPIGTVLTVELPLSSQATAVQSYLLPLSAVTVGQNENYVFINQQGRAKKVSVSLGKVTGEKVYITGEISEDALVVVDGNKLLEDGDILEIKDNL
jgi:RND family efflux transporter MFP subunit